jgi:uncharacterized coiled-coil protein SlyX
LVVTKVLIDREVLGELCEFFQEDEDYRRDREQFLYGKLCAALEAKHVEPVEARHGIIAGGYKQLGDFRPPAVEQHSDDEHPDPLQDIADFGQLQAALERIAELESSMAWYNGRHEEDDRIIEELESTLAADKALLDRIGNELDDVAYSGEYTEGIKALKGRVAGLEALNTQLVTKLTTANAALVMEHETRQAAERDADRFQSALSDIALAGMSLPADVGGDDETYQRFHAKRAWEFIGIAARAITTGGSMLV